MSSFRKGWLQWISNLVCTLISLLEAISAQMLNDHRTSENSYSEKDPSESNESGRRWNFVWQNIYKRWTQEQMVSVIIRCWSFLVIYLTCSVTCSRGAPGQEKTPPIIWCYPPYLRHTYCIFALFVDFFHPPPPHPQEILYLSRGTRKKLKGMKTRGYIIDNLRYADDAALAAKMLQQT